MPNTPGTELTRLIGKAWEAISEQDRKHYDEKARVAAEEYKVKLQQLQQAERATLTNAGFANAAKKIKKEPQDYSNISAIISPPAAAMQQRQSNEAILSNSGLQLQQTN